MVTELLNDLEFSILKPQSYITSPVTDFWLRRKGEVRRQYYYHLGEQCWKEYNYVGMIIDYTLLFVELPESYQLRVYEWLLI